MKGKPKYKLGDIVKFSVNNIVKTGVVYIVDAYGTFEDPSDASYDVLVENDEERCLYKHISERYVLEVLGA